MELGGSRGFPAPEGAAPRSWWVAGRGWIAAGALAALLVLTGFLGVQLVESERRVEQLRAELRGVYTEAESLRTAGAGSEQRVAVLEQQLRQLRAERETLLKRLQAQPEVKPPAAAGTKPAARKPASRSPARPAR